VELWISFYLNNTKINMKKIIVFVAILIVLAASYMNRTRISDVVDEMQKPDLPVAQEFRVQGSELRDEEEKNLPVTDNKTIDKDPNVDIPKIIEPEPVIPQEIIKDTPEPVQDTIKELPVEYNLAVPFQPQAPHANWSLPYAEACEETSLIMADRFFNNKGLSASEADEEIKKLVEWEKKELGYYEDTSAKEVVKIAKEYFGFNVELDYDVTVANIKQHLANNKVIIVPASGRQLGNPYFTGEGPVYHMLVIRGYTKDKFITNDPGTKRGEEFLYSYGTLINAIHDWPLETGGDRQEINQKTVETGDKVLIVVGKQL
jgi:hypothetical protein